MYATTLLREGANNCQLSIYIKILKHNDICHVSRCLKIEPQKTQYVINVWLRIREEIDTVSDISVMHK